MPCTASACFSSWMVIGAGELGCAVDLADESGIAALTIRSLAQSMGTKPMSLYYHVANKDEILDGIMDMVFGEIELPSDSYIYGFALQEAALPFDGRDSASEITAPIVEVS